MFIFFCLLLLTQNISLLTLLVTRCVGIFLHNKQVSHISWMFYNLTQSWDHLPRDSVRSYRLEAQPKTAPPTPTSDASQKLRLSPVLQTRQATDWRFQLPSPQIWLICRVACRPDIRMKEKICWKLGMSAIFKQPPFF